jgi:hypothetical protein|tara:strand:+ start:216 stop:398 length:183 start_codon:yes stop_codon:yes gene_type:complete
VKVGSLVRRKPHPITRQPEVLGLVMEMSADKHSIRVALLEDHGKAPAITWRTASNFEVLS